MRGRVSEVFWTRAALSGRSNGIFGTTFLRDEERETGNEQKPMGWRGMGVTKRCGMKSGIIDSLMGVIEEKLGLGVPLVDMKEDSHRIETVVVHY